jgi:hypothetical protein
MRTNGVTADAMRWLSPLLTFPAPAVTMEEEDHSVPSLRPHSAEDPF